MVLSGYRVAPAGTWKKRPRGRLDFSNIGWYSAPVKFMHRVPGQDREAMAEGRQPKRLQDRTLARSRSSWCIWACTRLSAM